MQCLSLRIQSRSMMVKRQVKPTDQTAKTDRVNKKPVKEGANFFFFFYEKSPQFVHAIIVNSVYQLDCTAA